MLDLFNQIIKWRRDFPKVKFRWSQLHLSIVRDYFSNFSSTCDFLELPSLNNFRSEERRSPRILAEIAASFTDEFKQLFVVPRLHNRYEGDNRIKKYHLVEAFISFLLQLLYHKTDSIIYLCDDGIDNLEGELRFLLTILGDTSLMLCAVEHEEFHELLAEFEAVANQAGSLVHSLFFSTDPAFGKTNERTGGVLERIGRLNADIMKFLRLPTSINRSAHKTPKISVVDSPVIVDSLIHDLEDLMKQEDNRIADVKDQIKNLHQKLTPFQSKVKDIGPSQPLDIRELKESPLRIGDVAHEAEYLIVSLLVGDASLRYVIARLRDLMIEVFHDLKVARCCSTQLSLQAERNTEVNDFAVGLDKKVEEILSNLVGEGRPELLGEGRPELLGDPSLRYVIAGLRDLMNEVFHDLKVARCCSTQLSLQAERNTEVTDFAVGLDKKVEEILSNLVGEGRRELQLISIFGMAGIGKTTLAKKLYNHPLVKTHFDRLSWCVISQTYPSGSILTGILMDIKSNDDTCKILEMEKESLVVHIHQTLKGRRYLIVMDDVWDSNVWDDLRGCFPDEGNGSRILLTTRNIDVAPRGSITHELHSLSNDQCWELLKKKVFDNEPCPPQLLEIGEKIAKNCRGLPLAVVVIAGILSTMDKEKSEWEEVEANLTSYIFEDGDNTSVMQILELSYQHLPDNLKACFLYFGAFEEDKEISVRELMRLWIAEGFIHKEEGKSAENIAEEYLKQLIDRSLLMDAKKRSGGGVKTCVIHDLFRELCLKISEKENFFKFVKNDIYSMYEKGHRIQALKHPRNSSYCQQVRSFRGGRLNSDFYVRDMRSLRVLHFDYVDNHFIGIEYLVYLRYLVIRNLPASVEIDSLVNLEYLRVETDEGNKAVDLPPEIREMRKLRYLHVHPRPIYIKCRNSSQTNNLEFLSCVWIGKFEDEEMLQCSPHLQKLKCIYELVRLVGIRAYSIEYPHFDLSFFTQLDSLNLTFRSHHDRLRRLEKFTFPSNIRKLTLSGKSSQNIMSIIGGLENLEVLKLRFISFEEHRWDIRDEEFRKLRFLKLEKTNLTKWNVDLSQHFPPLQQLVLRDCYKLQEIPSDIFEITTLQMIEVKGRCLESLVELVKSIQKQQSDYTGSEELRVSIGRR